MPTCEKPPTRTMLLIGGLKEARSLFSLGLPVPVRITEKKGRKESFEFYWIARIDQTGIWMVSKEAPNGAEPIHYQVDTWNSNPEEWECDHNQVRNFCGAKATGCRHCLAVAQLIRLLK